MDYLIEVAKLNELGAPRLGCSFFMHCGFHPTRLSSFPRRFSSIDLHRRSFQPYWPTLEVKSSRYYYFPCVEIKKVTKFITFYVILVFRGIENEDFCVILQEINKGFIVLISFNSA